MKWHFSTSLGVSRQCEANIQECPLTHGNTPEEAQRKHEEAMAEETLVAHQRPRTRVPHRPPTAQERRSQAAQVLAHTALKDLDAAQLAQTLRHEAVVAGMDMATIDSAIDLATILHAHQTRGNRGNFTTTPYIEHPLRNAVRLLRLGVKDQDVAIAAVLHDTVEDGARVFVSKFLQRDDVSEPEARELLREHIRVAHGSEVLRLVDAVTNDYIADTDKSRMSLAEKNRVYLDHVASQVHGEPKVFLVKGSDFIDNATGLHHNDVPERRVKTRRQALKYIPVVEVFKREMDDMDLPISDEGREVLWTQLCKTTDRLTAILEKYPEE